MHSVPAGVTYRLGVLFFVVLTSDLKQVDVTMNQSFVNMTVSDCVESPYYFANNVERDAINTVDSILTAVQLPDYVGNRRSVK
jgi:hypothetical protein